jgi:hypothetical protein
MSQKTLLDDSGISSFSQSVSSTNSDDDGDNSTLLRNVLRKIKWRYLVIRHRITNVTNLPVIRVLDNERKYLRRLLKIYNN